MRIRGERVAERRRELRMGLGTLAVRVGTNYAAIAGIESGVEPRTVTLGLVGRLARVLGVDAGWLLDLEDGEVRLENEPNPPDEDTARLGACLVAAGRSVPTLTLRGFLGWSEERFTSAAEALDTRLRPCGQRLVSDATLGLLALASSPDTGGSLYGFRAQLRGSGPDLTLDVRSARVLYAVLSRQATRGAAAATSLSARAAIRRLVRAGVLEKPETGVDTLRLTAVARRSLLVDEAPRFQPTGAGAVSDGRSRSPSVGSRRPARKTSTRPAAGQSLGSW